MNLDMRIDRVWISASLESALPGGRCGELHRKPSMAFPSSTYVMQCALSPVCVAIDEVTCGVSVVNVLVTCCV